MANKKFQKDASKHGTPRVETRKKDKDKSFILHILAYLKNFHKASKE